MSIRSVKYIDENRKVFYIFSQKDHEESYSLFHESDIFGMVKDFQERVKQDQR